MITADREALEDEHTRVLAYAVGDHLPSNRPTADELPWRARTGLGPG